jgi:hypothetical protein
MAIVAAHDARMREIDDMRISEDIKQKLRKDADDQEVADLADLNRRIAAENSVQTKISNDATKRTGKSERPRRGK